VISLLRSGIGLRDARFGSRARRCLVQSLSLIIAAARVRSVVGVAEVVGIYLAEAGGRPMRSVRAVETAVGQGLRGDRYQTGTGEWSYDPRLYDDVTLIAVEVLAAVAAEHGVRLDAGMSRRNVETRGLDLDELVGRRFRVGKVELRGERPCEPCRYLDRVTGQSAKAALQGRGGLRASVIRGGVLQVGDVVTTQE